MKNELTEDISKPFTWYTWALKLLLASLLVSIVAAEIFLAILVLLWIVLLLRGYRYKPTRFDVPLLAFIGVRLLSIIVSEYPVVSVVVIWRELLFYVSYFCVVFFFQYADRVQIQKTVKWMYVSTSIVAIIAIAEFLLGMTQRARALTGGGTLATHLSILIVAFVFLRSDRTTFFSPVFAWSVFLILVTGLACTLTRGDSIATLAALVVYGLVFNRRVLIGVIVLVLVLVIAVPTMRMRFATLRDPMNNSSDRIKLWQEAARHTGQHPFLGFGPETFHLVFNDMQHLGDKYIGAWHNDVIQLYMESGIVGLVSYSVLFICLFGYSWRLIRRGDRENEKFDPGWMGILLLLAYLIIGMFGTPTFSITNGILFRFFVAWIVVEYQRSFQTAAA